MIRLVGKDTVEEDMLVCAQSKLRLEQDLTASADSGEGQLVVCAIHVSVGQWCRTKSTHRSQVLGSNPAGCKTPWPTCALCMA